jgi:hypothetical protein
MTRPKRPPPFKSTDSLDLTSLSIDENNKTSLPPKVPPQLRQVHTGTLDADFLVVDNKSPAKSLADRIWMGGVDETMKEKGDELDKANSTTTTPTARYVPAEYSFT